MSVRHRGFAIRLFSSSLNSQHRAEYQSHNRHSVNISKIMNSIGDYVSGSCWIRM